MATEKLTLDLTRLILTSLIVLPNIIGNVLVSYIILRIKTFRTLINMLLVHLAFTDIVVGVFAVVQPIFELTVQDRTKININLCKLIINQHVVFMGVVSSYTTIVLVALLRYYYITKPLQTIAFSRIRKLYIFIPMIWIISFILLSPRFYADFSNGLECARIVVISKISQISGGISIVARGFILPIVTLAYTYRKVYTALKEKLKTISTRSAYKYGAMRSARLLGLVIVAFIFCTAPYHMYGFLVSVVGLHRLSSSVFLEMILFCVFILGSSVNPYLYWFHCQRFRKMTYKLLAMSHRVQPVTFHQANNVRLVKQLQIKKP